MEYAVIARKIPHSWKTQILIPNIKTGNKNFVAIWYTLHLWGLTHKSGLFNNQGYEKTSWLTPPTWKTNSKPLENSKILHVK